MARPNARWSKYTPLALLAAFAVTAGVAFTLGRLTDSRPEGSPAIRPRKPIPRVSASRPAQRPLAAIEQRLADAEAQILSLRGQNLALTTRLRGYTASGKVTVRRGRPQPTPKRADRRPAGSITPEVAVVAEPMAPVAAPQSTVLESSQPVFTDVAPTEGTSLSGASTTSMTTAASSPAVALTEGRCEPEKPCKVRVFFATDRKAIGKREIARRYRKVLDHSYGWKRDDRKRERDYELSFGSCLVSIPPHRKELNVSSPRLLGTWDATKHDMLMSISEPMSFTSLRDQLNARMRAADPNKRQLLLFIHGYNVPFEEAARRTAQIYWDLEFKGAPVFYSWPSAGKILRYWADESSVEWTTPHLRDFLRRLAQETDAQQIHLIAHSMGNRALTNALAQLASENAAIARTAQCAGATTACPTPLKPAVRFNQVVLAAPDMDRATFEQLAESVKTVSEKITLYASRKDRAVLGSWFLHYFKRLGMPTGKAEFIAGIDAVDATLASTGFLGHSYYGSSLLWDISNLLCDPTLPAEKRPTLKGKDDKGYYTFTRTTKDVPSVVVRGTRVVTRRRRAERIVPSCPAPVASTATAGGGR